MFAKESDWARYHVHYCLGGVCRATGVSLLNVEGIHTRCKETSVTQLTTSAVMESSAARMKTRSIALTRLPAVLILTYSMLRQHDKRLMSWMRLR